MQNTGQSFFFKKQVIVSGGGLTSPDSWSYYAPLTVDSSLVVEDHDNFPIYFDLNRLGSTFWNNIETNGDSLRISTNTSSKFDDSDFECPFELQGFDKTANSGALYFSTGSALSSTSNTTFYLYWDNPSATIPATGSALGSAILWLNANYDAIYQLDIESGVSSEVTDYSTISPSGTTNANGHKARQGGITFGDSDYDNGVGTSKYGPTWEMYQGSSPSFTLNNPDWTLAPAGIATLETLINVSSNWQSFAVFMDIGRDGTNATQVRMQRNSSTSQLQFFDGSNIRAGGSIPTGQYNYLAFGAGSGLVTGSINGNRAFAGTCKTNFKVGVSNDRVYLMGYNSSGARPLNSVMAQARISFTEKKTEQWFETTYNTFLSQSSFISVGTIVTL